MRNHHLIILSLFLIFLLIHNGKVFSYQVENPMEEVFLPAHPVLIAEENPPAGVGKPSQQADTISFYFDNIDIYELIHIIFRDVLDINYIIDPRVRGQISFRTTMSLRREEILPIMEIILRLNGVGIVKEGEIYTIVPIQGIAKEPSAIQFGKDPNSFTPEGTAVVQIIPLEYISSTEMNNILTPFITQGATLIEVPNQNFLIISDIDTNIRRMLEIITVFDKKDYIEVAKPNIYVYLLQNSKADHVASILQELLLGGATTTPKKEQTPLIKRAPAYQKTTPEQTKTPQQVKTPTITPQKSAIDEEPLVSPGTKIFHDEISNAIIILATKTDYRLIEETIKKLDMIPRQVSIDVLIADISLVGDLQFGVDWLIKGSFMSSGNRKKIDLSLDTPPVGSGGITFKVTAGDETRVLITALVREDKAELLASPHILASDNNEAKIQIGSEQPIITTREDIGTAEVTRPVENVQYRDTGIILLVTPQINAGGLIAMDVEAQLSKVEFDSQLNLPAFPKIEAKTNLIVQDGDTIVIGGLIREDTTDNLTGVPFLSKVPLLGALFRFKQDRKEKREVVVLLTPRVIKNREESDVVSKDFINKLKNLKRSLKYQVRGQQGISGDDF